ncbi:MAG: ABC transporter ATP-binding protein [Gammaproteobacteria bacterium]|nr:ABC transporter ATP-binding protein [Gammaproteobacteria bacterium]MDE0443857.1 ABC transporter ATP-binding protein [Gammaproteobacteria bacterium]
MNGAAAKTQPARNYSAFDAELTHQALNTRLFLRLLKWAKPYRVTLIASAVLVIVGSGLSVLMPLVQNRILIDEILVPNKAAEAPDYGLVEALNWCVEVLSIQPLAVAVLFYIAIFVVQTLFGVAQQLLLASGALKTLRDLRIDLFASLERKPASFYDHVAVGRVMTRVTNDIENLFDLLTGFVSRAGIVIPFFFALAVMLHASFKMTLIGLAIIPVAAVATYYYRMVMREIFRRIRDSVSALNQYIQEDLLGIEVVQLSGREEMNMAQYDELNRDNRRQEYRAVPREIAFETFNMSLSSIATAAILWYGGGQVVQEAISLGTLTLFTHFIQMMIAPVSSVGYFFNILFRAMASGERVFQALDWDERLHEPEHPVNLPERLNGEVVFRNVNFAYPGGEPVLKGISFDIAQGEKLAIVGPTGSGKSTMIRLLARFYDFDDGIIFVDGHDVNHIASTDLRKRIGVVLQDFHIFSGTVGENISLNNPDISQERVEWAARVVNADPFIRELEDGYDTELAERGHNLSQGQQQLLAFARVLAADPEILVLDEATSSIDTGTELIIQDALHKLTEGRTSIIIAHRLQTIQECDRILVLHHGVIRELGTHDELIAQQGIYYTLHELQFQDSQVAAELAGEKEEKPKPRFSWTETGDDEPFPEGGMEGEGGMGGPGMGGSGMGGPGMGGPGVGGPRNMGGPRDPRRRR